MVTSSSPLLTLGYESVFTDLNTLELPNGLHPVWGKLPVIQEAMTKYPSAEWIWWLDADVIIMTPDFDLYEHVLSPAALGRVLLTGKQIITNERMLREGTVLTPTV